MVTLEIVTESGPSTGVTENEIFEPAGDGVFTVQSTVTGTNSAVTSDSIASSSDPSSPRKQPPTPTNRYEDTSSRFRLKLLANDEYEITILQEKHWALSSEMTTLVVCLSKSHHMILFGSEIDSL
jgi:hypothetical protein